MSSIGHILNLRARIPFTKISIKNTDVQLPAGPLPPHGTNQRAGISLLGAGSSRASQTAAAVPTGRVWGVSWRRHDRATEFFRPPCPRAHCLERGGNGRPLRDRWGGGAVGGWSGQAASGMHSRGGLGGRPGALPRAAAAVPCKARRACRTPLWEGAPDLSSCVPGAREWPGTSAPAPLLEGPHYASHHTTVVLDPSWPSSSPL